MLIKFYTLSTSPGPRRYPTLFNADVLNCYINTKISYFQQTI